MVNTLLLHAHSVAPLLCAPQTVTAPLLRTPLTADCAQHRTQVKSRALRIWARLCCTMSRRESTAAATQPVVALLRAAAALLRRFSNPRPHSAVLAVCITSWSDERGVKWSGTLSSFALVPPHVPADAHCCLTVAHHSNLVQCSTMRLVHPWFSMVVYSTQACLRRLVHAGSCGHERSRHGGCCCSSRRWAKSEARWRLRYKRALTPGTSAVAPRPLDTTRQPLTPPRGSSPGGHPAAACLPSHCAVSLRPGGRQTHPSVAVICSAASTSCCRPCSRHPGQRLKHSLDPVIIPPPAPGQAVIHLHQRRRSTPPSSQPH